MLATAFRLASLGACVACLTACSPGQKQDDEAWSGEPTRDGGWASGLVKDEFSDKEFHLARGEVEIEDAHNGRIKIGWTYTDGDAAVAASFIYLGGEKQSATSCPKPAFAKRRVGARNENGALESGAVTRTCNALSIQYVGETIYRVLRSSDYRIRLALADGNSPVFRMNFVDNAALRAFAQVAMAGTRKAIAASKEAALQARPAPSPAPPVEQAAPPPPQPDISPQPRPDDFAPEPAGAQPPPPPAPPWEATRVSSRVSSREPPRLVVVRRFYDALRRAKGSVAAALVIPEKRNSGPLSASQMTNYYSHLAVPLHVRQMREAGDDSVTVQYTTGPRAGLTCRTTVAVTMDNRRGRAYPLIGRIRVVENTCY